eukprot:CAMPEP_0170589346 /NCGR_PEP_ID=MMETSP0224-20130122/11303_1 /TAXON_ID=285029 /ORGANISM="Togula jolla, Strain CCCM 725" /LENGTH=339 /DNA_ID=CAMNT_0010913101 /DNA_START=50 /DNA_END=1069 /DNA_ORIENTATION=+
MALWGLAVLACVMQALGGPNDLDCAASENGQCMSQSHSLLATRSARMVEESQILEDLRPSGGDPVAIQLIDEDDARQYQNGTEMLQVSCTPPPGVTCVCENPKYPCYRAYGDGCACWSHQPKEYCESAGGSFCERASTCVDHCELCKDAQTCSACKAGYMLVYGRCTKRPAERKDRWLKAHNVLRCVHGVQPVTWLSEAEQSAQAWVDGLSSLKHSDCYSEPPPAGPAGENLAMGYSNPEAAASAWYKEVECCDGLPGCHKGSCTVGHFTAMVWKGVKKIGCATNAAKKIDACRYWSGDTLSYDTANMGGGFDKNVLVVQKELQTCIDEADAVVALDVV